MSDHKHTNNACVKIEIYKAVVIFAGNKHNKKDFILDIHQC